jgi:hypothetical protein
MHMFDIDIPGHITFKESDYFAAGDKPTIVDTGIYDLDSNLKKSLAFVVIRLCFNHAPQM